MYILEDVNKPYEIIIIIINKQSRLLKQGTRSAEVNLVIILFRAQLILDEFAVFEFWG